jgi:hypothetical protein
MMKRAILSTFIFVFLTAILFAQSPSEKKESKITLGVLGGLNIPKLQGSSSNEMSRDYTSRIGEAFGLMASYDIGSKFSLRIDALYSSEGGKRNGIQAIDASSVNPLAPAGTYLYADFKNESILNYFEIPVLAKYNFPVGKSSKLYINLGPYAGFLLNAKQKTSGTSIIYADRAETMPVVPVAQSFDASNNVTSDINTTNFGVIGGVGFTQTVGYGDIFMDIRGGYGLTIVQKDTKNGSSHIGNLLIALGYSIPL